MKTCNKCQTYKSFCDFHKDKVKKDGLRNICKVCAIANQKKYADVHRDHYRTLNKQHYDQNKIYYKEYYLNNINVFEKYYQENIEKIKTKQRIYRKNSHFTFNAKNAQYRALKKQAMPKWVDKEQIKEIYKNCPDGHHVDHIIPLNHPDVCGLHVPWNLQYLTVEENLKKSNKIKE